MAVDDPPFNLGPLPQYDEKATLQSESLKAFHKLLFGVDAFVFRDERIEDYGVDFSLELKLAGQVTNFRSQVQLKGTSQPSATKAGYISHDVAVANLNYLLSGPSPLYLLWDAQKDEFWYVWAQDESRRLLQDNPSWRTQQDITLQFWTRFTKESVPTVVERILQEGRLHREIHDRLARATEGEQVVIRIDSESLRITDGYIAASLLLASGTAIVAAGYPRQVLELVRLIDSANLNLSRMQLTIAYAEYMVGNHWQALAHLRQALSRGMELSARDRNFLENLKDACELHAGLIDSAKYQERMAQRAATLKGLEALEATQEVLYRACVTATDLAERSQYAKDLRSVTEQMLEHAEAPAAVKLNAKTLLLFVEGVEANLAATRTAFAADIHSQLFPGEVEGVVQRFAEARNWHASWEEQATQVLKEAYDLNHPILIFQALIILLRIRIGRLFEERQEAIIEESAHEIRASVRASIDRILQDATKLNDLNQSVEGRLQLDELRSDFLELDGNREDAKKIAAATYPVAEAMGFVAIADHAKRLLNDSTLLQQWELRYRELREEDSDIQHASQTDAEISRMADQFLLSMGPGARREVVVEILHSLRQISRERVEWCRHLAILEDLSMTRDPNSAYSELPSRKCACQKFEYESPGASTDATRVITQFKQEFCMSCLSRDPKRPSDNAAAT
jgi:hypothetical protein